MPNKLAIAALKAALQDSPEAAKEFFKKKFTPGFYHGSGSNKIKAFDPEHSASEFGSSGNFLTGEKDANATFLTKDPSFASSFLPSGMQLHAYKPGATIYPVSANLGKHFDYETPEGHQVIKEYLAKVHPVPTDESLLKQWMRDRITTQNELKDGSWAAIENPAFQQHLRDTGHDSFALQEAGRKNVGIFEPHNIRGKFAEYDPAEEFNPDFMKSEGGAIEHHIKGGKVGAALGALDSLAPKSTVTGYKLFRTDPKKPGELFPLFVNRNQSVPIGEWVPAEAGPLNELGRVKSSIGSNGMAYRPGWHAGDVPAATHIGGKSGPQTKVVDYRKPEEVWAEVEMPNDVDWQSVANANAKISKSGQPIAKTAEITDQIPFGGHYRYKTNPNMQGNWLIGGQMKVNKVLTDEEVRAINEAAGTADLPRFTKFDKPMGTPEEGMANGGAVQHFAAGGLPNLPEGGDLLHQQAKSELPDVSMDVRTMPNMTGMPGVGYMQMPQSAMARLQLEKELENQARLRAGVSAMGMAIPGQSGVRVMPGQMDVGANIPVGPGHLDLSAMRSINPMPGRGHMQGVRANYSIPFSTGGNVIKKALQYAKPVPFVHYSHADNIARLEPSAYGTGIKGAEANRLKNAPDIRDRAFFYPDNGNIRPESGLGPNKYIGTSEASYPLHEDPADYRLIARAKAKDPYLGSIGIDQINQDLYHNELERQIKNAGYTGYHTDDAGVLFHPTLVNKAD